MNQRITVKQAWALYHALGPKPAMDAVVEGDFGVTVEDLPAYVQVRYTGQQDFGTLYTYTDPTGELEPGDFVEAPTQHQEDGTAVVVKLGRGSFKGKPREITAVFERVPLA